MCDDDSPDVFVSQKKKRLSWCGAEQPHVPFSRMEIGKRLAGTGRVCVMALFSFSPKFFFIHHIESLDTCMKH